MEDKDRLTLITKKHEELERETKKLINNGQWSLLTSELQKRVTESLIGGKVVIKELTEKVNKS